MRLFLYGGFGEKGRTCVGIESGGYRLLLDAGIKTGARGRDFYPAISEHALGTTDAIVVTHAHEDHVGALGWCIAGGFRGRIFMTAEARREADLCLAAYAEPEHLLLTRRANVERLPLGENISLGPLRLSTGRSGHVAGGVWCAVDNGQVTLGYCGDVVPASPVFAMDPISRCQAAVVDASYGDDDVSSRERAAQVIEWIAARPMGCVLPSPLYGRSAELLAILQGPIALCAGMRDALRTQIAGDRWLVDGVAGLLAKRLAAAADWQDGAAFPRAALLCHDGMGIAGPSREILARARAQEHPTLFTGHLPQNSPGKRMVADGRAAWIRVPTHPTLPENLAIVAASGATTVFGHSCDRATLARLAPHLRSLRTDVATGDYLDL